MESPCRRPCTPSGPLEILDGLRVRDDEQATGIEPGDASLGSATGSSRARAAPGPKAILFPMLFILVMDVLSLLITRASEASFCILFFSDFGQ